MDCRHQAVLASRMSVRRARARRRQGISFSTAGPSLMHARCTPPGRQSAIFPPVTGPPPSPLRQLLTGLLPPLGSDDEEILPLTAMALASYNYKVEHPPASPCVANACIPVGLSFTRTHTKSLACQMAAGGIGHGAPPRLQLVLYDAAKHLSHANIARPSKIRPTLTLSCRGDGTTLRPPALDFCT